MRQEVEAPCAGAELHQTQTYSACTDGHVDLREKDLWCCPDWSTKETDSLLSATGETCGGSTVASGCASHDIQSLKDCSEAPRTDAARKCDNAGCHYSINYDSYGGCVVACID